MKVRLPLFLKKALLAATLAYVGFCNTLLAADIVINTTGEQALTGWDNGGSTLTFATGSDGATVNYSANLSGFSALTVDVDGATLRSSSNSGNFIVIPAGGTADWDINGNFTLDLGSAATSPNQYSRNLAIGTGTLNIDITTGKTFTLKGDMAGDANGNFNISGGGTLAYTYTDVSTSAGTQHAGVNLSISGGSTWDISSNASSALSSLMLGGEISLDAGAINLMSGSVTWDQGLTVSGASSISGSTDLTITGALDMAASSSLDFGATGIDLSSLTFDLEGLADGDTISFIGTNISGLTAGDTLTGSGLTAAQTGTWSHDAASNTWSLSISGYTSKNLNWAGNDGTLAVGTGGWTEAGSTQTLSEHDNITIGGDAIAGGVIIVEGDVLVNSISIAGDADFTLTSDAAVTPGTLSASTGMVKNGSGTLVLAGDVALAGSKQLNEGTLAIHSTNALGEGQIQIASGTTLATAADLGSVTAWSGDVYNRSGAGYTVDVATGTTLKDNVNLLIGGTDTKIQGGGSYEIWGFTLSASNNASNLTIETDTTLVIKGEVMSRTGGEGSFMMSNWPQSNTLTIKGTLDSNAGISTRDAGTSTINIEDGGELILRKGLAAVSHDTVKTININVKDGATLALDNKSYAGATGTYIQMSSTVYMQDGSTLRAVNETMVDGYATTTVDDAINYAENASVTFVADAAPGIAQRLILNHDINLGTGSFTTEGHGFVTTGGNVTAGAVTLSNQLNMAAGTSITAMGDFNAAYVGAQQLDTSKAISIAATNGAEGIIATNGFYNLTMENVSLTSQLLPTVFKNTTLRNSSLGALSYSIEGNVVLDNVDIAAGSTLTLTDEASLTLKGSSLTALDIIEAKDTVDLTLQDYEATATLGAITQDQAITTQEGGHTTMDLYTLHIADLEGYKSVTLTDSLLINLEMTEAEYAAFTAALGENGVAFAFDPSAELKMWYGAIDLSITVNGMAQGSFSMVGETGDLVYIPEPSSATLSLLALTALLARRRRKVA